MANIGQIWYNVAGETGSYPSGIDIYTDILTQITPNSLTKIGIQAPPGTQLQMNGIKEIMIGRTGIYELDEGISITSLKFYRPKTYEVNKEETAKNQVRGQEQMDAAKEAYDKTVAGLDKFSSTYYQELQKAESTYSTALNAGYSLYQTKIYDAEEGDLTNVIIDYIYE